MGLSTLLCDTTLIIAEFYVHDVRFGTTANGNAFIVTEFMAGGSLSDLLRDQARTVLWRTRIAIGLEIALGMAHLHSRGLLHRDLKSGNVLLDEHLNAKVGDLGLSRVARPSRQHIIVHSPFTGAMFFCCVQLANTPDIRIHY